MSKEFCGFRLSSTIMEMIKIVMEKEQCNKTEAVEKLIMYGMLHYAMK